MDTKEHWLKGVLLNFQSGDEEKNQEAWIHIGKITGKNASSFSSTADAIARAYEGLGSDVEREEFLQELAELVKFSKKHQFSLETMDAIILAVVLLNKMDMFAEIFARNFVFAWRNARERSILSRTFLSSCESLRESPAVYHAVSYLLKNKWIPRRYAVDACIVLLETNPEKWFTTLAQLVPVISRYKNKFLHEEGAAGLKIWGMAETVLLEKIKSLGNEE